MGRRGKASFWAFLAIHGLVWCAGAYGYEPRRQSLVFDAAIQLPSHYVCSIAWRQDGRRIAVGCDNGVVTVLEPTSGKVIWKRDAHPMEGLGDVAVAFARDSNNLVVNSSINGIAIWEQANGQTRCSLGESASRAAVDVAIRHDRQHSRYVVYAAAENDLVSWNIVDGKLMRRIAGAGKYVASIAVTEDGRLMATGLDSGKVIVYDWPAGRKLFETRSNKYDVRGIELSPDARFLVAGGTDAITCWNVEKKQRLWSKRLCCASRDGIAISPDSSCFASSAGRGRFTVRDIRTGTVVSSMTYGDDQANWGPFAFSADGKRIATASDDLESRLVIWRMGGFLKGQTDKSFDEVK